MEWMHQLFQIAFLGGFFFIILGMITYLFPPKKINYLYGYRTPASMKSEERWHFAQKFSTMAFLKTGLFLVLFSPLGLLIKTNEETRFFLEIGVLISSVLNVILMTELKLKKNFPNPKNVN
jgi:uncharacterized membrane protein